MAKKSLTEAARGILMNESDDPTPDRDAKKSNPNMATLRPNSKYKEEEPIVNPGAIDPDADDYEDTGEAITHPEDGPSSSFVAGKGAKKDKSKSASSPVSSEPMKKISEEEESEFELTEELEAFIAEKIEEGLSEDEIAQAIEENFELVSEDEEQIDEEEKVPTKPAVELKDIKEHVDALLEGEELSEEFRSKAETIFEAAVTERVEQHVATLEEAYAASLEEEVEAIVENLTTQIDDYLNYVVEQWVEANEVAIESGLRTELTEDFITGMRNLLAEHYIDIPEEKVNVVEELANEVDELKSTLNEEISRNVELSKTLNEYKKFEALVEAVDGLTVSQAEKLKSLAENLEFVDEEDYGKKLETLRESYFPSKASTGPNELEKADESSPKTLTENLNGPMANYVKALGKSLPK